MAALGCYESKWWEGCESKEGSRTCERMSVLSSAPPQITSPLRVWGELLFVLALYFDVEVLVKVENKVVVRYILCSSDAADDAMSKRRLNVSQHVCSGSKEVWTPCKYFLAFAHKEANNSAKAVTTM